MLDDVPEPWSSLYCISQHRHVQTLLSSASRRAALLNRFPTDAKLRSRSSENMGSVEAERWCFRFFSWTRAGAGVAEVEPDPDAVWLGFDDMLRSDAGTSTWAKNICQTKFVVNRQALTILNMDNLIDESLVCQLGQ